MQQRHFFVFLAVLLVILLLRCVFFFTSQANFTNGQEVAIQTTLTQEPKEKGRVQQLTAQLPNGRKVFVSTPLYPHYSDGDTLQIQGSLTIVKTKTGEFVSLNFPKITVVQSSGFSGWFVHFFAGIRHYISHFFALYLPPNQSALLIGIVFGIKEPMQKSFSEDLATVGLVHIIAASGMNVTLVAGFLSGILIVFLKRKMALVVALFGVLFFAVLSGLEPSIVRAAIMAAMAFSAQILGRQRLASYGLFLAAFLMLFIDPSMFISLSFQLSFLSTAGLLYIRPLFERSKKLKTLLERSIIGEDLTTTVAAQLATAPLLIVYFGTYSPWSIMANLLVLWTIPLLMLLGAIALLLSLLSSFLGGLVLYATIPFLSFIEAVVKFFGQNTQAWTFPQIGLELIVGYYFLLIAVILAIKRASRS